MKTAWKILDLAYTVKKKKNEFNDNAYIITLNVQ